MMMREVNKSFVEFFRIFTIHQYRNVDAYNMVYAVKTLSVKMVQFDNALLHFPWFRILSLSRERLRISMNFGFTSLHLFRTLEESANTHEKNKHYDKFFVPVTFGVDLMHM